ncbi:MAG: SpoIIE family protein phosphatase [Rhodothermales bacterium]|nr:SpoIIE family protein phosphatase [Rhodothermales bacterium]
MARYSILVVEDEHTLRRLLEYRLSKQYNVRTAANGEEALDRIHEDIPHLIISDIMMPRMDGFALQGALQENKETRAIPFIFLTAKADEQSRLRGMRTGVDDYITKPFDIEQLLSRIERLLERTKIFQEQLDARLGHDFSQKLIPKKMPQVEGYRTFFHNSPREHGGGDLFDWTEPRPGLYFFTVGDVMGKGIQAKFYAFSFLGYVRSILHGMLQDSTSPAELMRRVNRVLTQDELMQETFASLLLLRWEPGKHEITYANAGHCRPVLLSGDDAQIIEYSDMVLGLDAETEFTDTTLAMPPGSVLVTYTDGLIEQQVGENQMLGEQGLLEAASRSRGRPTPVESLLLDVLQRSPNDDFTDDILVFWLERTAE